MCGFEQVQCMDHVALISFLFQLYETLCFKKRELSHVEESLKLLSPL